MIQAITTINNNQARRIRHFKGAEFSAPETMLPQDERNYCLFNMNKVNFIASQGTNALPYVKNVLTTSTDEKEIVEALYIIDRMLDKGVKGIPAMYPVLAKFNNTESANIQVYLAGIYRKTQVPDAFGPLVAMLIRNSNGGLGNPPYNSEAKCEGGKWQSAKNAPALLPSCPPAIPFDSNEEIGGAILEYIRNYSNNPKVIDYTA